MSFWEGFPAVRGRTIARTGQRKKGANPRSGVRSNRKKGDNNELPSSDYPNVLFEKSRDGMVLMDCQSWDVLDINPSFEKLMGYSKNDMQGKKIWDVPPDENGETLKRTFFEIFQKGNTHFDFVPMKTKSNGIVNLELNTTIIDNPFKKSLLCVCRPNQNGTGPDLNHSVLGSVPGSAMELNQFSNELIENANLIIIFITPEGDISLFNNKAEQFTGIPREEIHGKKFYDMLVSRKSRDSVKIKFKQMITGSSFNENFNFPLLDDNGVEHQIYWRSSVIYNTNNDVRGVLAIGEDITGLKVMERRLKLYSDAIKSSIDSMIITDMNGYIIYNNRAAETVYGYESEELLGKNYSIFYPDENRTEVTRIVRILSEKGSWQGEHVHRRRKGEKIPIYQTLSLIRDENQKSIAIMAVSRDISASKILEQKLRSAQHHSQLYLDILTHDLNNINQGIQSQLELFKNTLTQQLDQGYRVDSALNQLKIGITLINKVKKLTKIEHDKKSFSSYDLSSVIEYGYKTVAMRYPSKQIRIWGNFRQGNYKINVDEFIYELFTNLIDNAVKFDKRELVEVGINLNPVKRNSRSFIKISVLDQGRGIPPEDKSRVFDKNNRSRISTNSSGLGLYIVKALVNRYEGDLTVEDRVPNDYNKGSVFSVFLPLKP